MDKERVKKILNSDFRYMYLVSMISADTNVLEEDIRRNLGYLETLQEFLMDKEFAAEINSVEEVESFVKDGIKILNRDLKEYK